MTLPPNESGGLDARQQIDLLISRIADGEAHDTDWQSFEHLAAQDPAAWKDLALSQRQNAELGLAVGVALHTAERVALPLGASSSHAQHHRGAGDEHPLARLRAWGGWAIAAVVALAWFGGNRFSLVQPAPTTPTLVAGVPADWTTDDLARAYLNTGRREGRVYGELPERLLIDARPAEQGRGYEVVYVRQFVERAQVNDLVRLGIDESGNSVPVPVPRPARVTDPQ